MSQHLETQQGRQFMKWLEPRIFGFACDKIRELSTFL
jgi:hypothetical protein